MFVLGSGRVEMTPIKKSERVLQTLKMIQEKDGIKAREIARELQVGTRTVYRYIEDLRKMGIKIEASSGAAGGYISKGHLALKALTFTGLEATAILLASHVLAKTDGIPLRRDLENALEKITGATRPEGKKYLRLLKPKISILVDYIKNYNPWENIFSMLNKAMMYQQTINIKYHSFSSQKFSERRVNPYHIFFRDGAWYIIAYCYQRQELRTFRLDRIHGAKLTKDNFEIDSDFNVDKYFEHSWRLAKGEAIDVKVRIFPPISFLIMESEWHPTQKIEHLDDDSLIFGVTVEGAWEIKKWIMGWGEHAVVLEPPELRDEIEAELRNMVKNYERKEG